MTRQPPTWQRARSAVLVLAGVVLTGGLAVAGPASTARADLTRAERHATVLQILDRDPVAVGSMYACLYRLYMQGLGIKQAITECEQQLPALGNKDVSSIMPDYLGPAGGGGGGGGSGWGGGDTGCPGSLAGPAARGRVFTAGPLPPDPRTPGVDFGGYSWGGRGEVRNSEEWFKYRGLSEQESELRKREAVENYVDALRAWEAAWNEYEMALHERSAAGASGDANRITAAEARQKAASEALDKAKETRERALREAQADPNKAPPDVARVDPDAPGCGSDALAMLRECDRVAWVTAVCQQLYAEEHNCADPALMMPNPLDGGVRCGEAPMPENAAEVLAAWCRQHVRPTPGEDPCAADPTQIDTGGGRFAATGHVWRTEEGNPIVCGSPLAIVTEESCAVPLTVPAPERADVRTILLVALDRLGGPVLVLPADPPPGWPPVNLGQSRATGGRRG